MAICQTFNAILFCVVHVPHVHEAQVYIESCDSCWINSDTGQIIMDVKSFYIEKIRKYRAEYEKAKIL